MRTTFDPLAFAVFNQWLRSVGYFSPVHLGQIDWRKQRRRGWKQRRSSGYRR
jgi:hypothetical protein